MLPMELVMSHNHCSQLHSVTQSMSLETLPNQFGSPALEKPVQLLALLFMAATGLMVKN